MDFVSYLKKYFFFLGHGTYIRTGHVVVSRVLAMFIFGYVQMSAYVFKCASTYFTDENGFLGWERVEEMREGKNEKWLGLNKQARAQKEAMALNMFERQ